MANTTSTPFDWVRQISKSLIQLDEIPLLASPPFNWDRFSQQISQTFELKEFQIAPTEWQWRTPEELQAGLGQPLRFTTIALSPLSGNLWWVMAEEDLSKLMGWLLTKTTDPLPIKQQEYQDAFYHFAVLKALDFYQKTAATANLAPSLKQPLELPNEEMFCLDVSLRLQHQSLCGRLLISKELRKQLKAFFAKQQAPLNAPIAKDIDITVSINGGKTKMSLEEWHHVHSGDFILLDSCTADPNSEEKGVILAVNGKPFLQGTLKNGKLQIMESPLNEEEDIPMADEAHEEEHAEAHHEEDEFTGLDEVFEDEAEQHAEPIVEEENEEEESQIHESEQEVVIATPTQEEQQSEEHSPAPASTVAVETVHPESEKSILSHEIPIFLTVEIARVRMNMQTLMNLQPGNMLDLTVHPEQGVHLTINGKVVGRGELLRIGETLGVRILEIN